MEEVAAVKGVKLIDLDDNLMKKWLSKMSITEQTAVTRVCKRIKNNAYKLTTIMFAHELPDDFRIKIIPKLPMLKKIGLLIPKNPWNESMDMKLRRFLKCAVAQNPKIERVFGITSEFKCYFLEMAKLHHKDYDGSTFKTLIAEEYYEKLLKKFPGIKIRQRIHHFENEEYTTSVRTREKRLSDPDLAALSVVTAMSPYNFSDIITMTKNLTDLHFQQTRVSRSPNFAHIFDSIVNLRLKKLTFEEIPVTAGQIFGWVKRDFDSFRKLLELSSLVCISLRFNQGYKTYRETLKCFLDCTRNNFHHFSTSSLDDNLSVSNFVYRGQEPQLCPSMFIGFQGDNDTFPMAQFIQKFNPKYREFEFMDRASMVKMIKDCTDLIRNQPKVHFVFYCTNQGSKWTISFRPIQLEDGKINFSAQLSPTHLVKKHQFF